MLKGNEQKRITVNNEHQEWYKPLFAKLERLGIASEILLASAFQFDPTFQQSRDRSANRFIDHILVHPS